jgi:hypothetical protein
MERRLMLCDSYSLLPALLEMYWGLWQAGRESTGFFLFGKWWSGFDNVSEYLDDLVSVMPEEGPVIEMMDAAERAEFEGLPDLVTVYRGAGKVNRWGACWSLDKQVAMSFPGLQRYRQKYPMLYTAKVPKNRILAIKLDRGEQEVVTLGAEIVRSQRIPIAGSGGVQ